MNKPKFETPDMVEKNIEKLAEIFPNCITEARDENGKLKKAVNFEMLQQILSTEFPPEGSPERYEFTWVGKRAAIAEANKPIRKTLRPCKAESKNWDTTENLYIEGDNLEVLKLLQESYLGKVKMIYIDPPYNTGNDFIYRDDFKQTQQEYDEQVGLFDEDENRLFKNTETNGRFHSDWCSMMYSRLMLAKNFLIDAGVIFISIDDNEQANLKKICDEIFGIENFCGIFLINTTPNGRDYGHIAKMHEFCLFYSKNIWNTLTFLLPTENINFKYHDEVSGFNIHPLYNSNESFNSQNRPNLYYPFYLYLDERIDNNFFNIGLIEKNNSIKIYPPKSMKNGVQFVWRWGKEKANKYMNKEIIGYRTNDGNYRIVQKMRHDEKLIRSILYDTKYSSRRGTYELEKLFEGKCFSFPKPVELLYDLSLVALDKTDIVLDFFSGSATTAHAVMQLNAEDGGHRKFIMVQLPEVCDEKSEAYKAGYKNICEIGKERLRRAGEKIKADNPLTTQDLDIGFRVFKVDSSNMNDVYYSAGEYSQDMLVNLEDNIKPDRTDLDLLFGCLLDWGLPISLPYTSEQIENCTVHTYNDGDLVACFDENIPESVIKEIAKRKPLRAVFRDAGFGSSPEKINVTEIFKMLAPDTDVKVI